jgi:DNA-binding transcriptional ArsR family regulator
MHTLMSDLCREISEFGKGISSQKRYLILEALMNGPKTVNQLVETVGMSQPAVSQHLKTLKQCGLVLDQRKGQTVIYSVNTKYLINLLKNLSQQVGEGVEQHA